MARRSAVSVIAVGLLVAVLLASCNDDVTVVQVPKNRPPQILLTGPEYETANPIKAPLPSLWVLAADPDGQADIAAVVLRISDITLNSVIVRPDDPGDECRRPFYADGDTVDITPYLRRTTFRVDDRVLWRGSEGTYGISLTYPLLTEGGLAKQGSVFGDHLKSCRWGYDYLYMVEEFGLYPPAISPPRDVYVTYADFSISGISVTVYDQSGATATKDFPDFRGFFTNSLEDYTLP
jgi:hypothetical protein